MFTDNFKSKVSKLAILLSNIFQLYIIFTLIDIINNGFNYTNFILLIFNIAYIISFQTYNKKINEIFDLRGRYLSLKRKNMSVEEINNDNEQICKKLFEEILDGDFRE